MVENGLVVGRADVEVVQNVEDVCHDCAAAGCRHREHLHPEAVQLSLGIRKVYFQFSFFSS